MQGMPILHALALAGFDVRPGLPLTIEQREWIYREQRRCARREERRRKVRFTFNGLATEMRWEHEDNLRDLRRGYHASLLWLQVGVMVIGLLVGLSEIVGRSVG